MKMDGMKRRETDVSVTERLAVDVGTSITIIIS